MKQIIFFSCFLLVGTLVYAQKDSVRVKNLKISGNLQNNTIQYNPLSPAKAAFYSAIFPGGGQIYNNRYWWQLPLIYGGLGISIYSYVDSNKKYNRYRTAFKLRKAGFDDEYKGIISTNGLVNAQKVSSKNRDLSLLSTILIYVLQIVEASVRAHLLQFDTSDNLSIKPIVIPDTQLITAPKVGFTLKYSF